MKSKPYFKGQSVNECGHYHPDVLMVRDVIRGSKVIRVLYCKFCGVSSEEHKLKDFHPDVLREALLFDKVNSREKKRLKRL